jgi:RimJ/RimL family protein N-acetyltransferase
MSFHDEPIEGFLWRIRSVQEEDASFVTELRDPDKPRSKYLNPISGFVQDQKEWIRSQRQTRGDYYFVLESIKTSKNDGLIGIYNLSPRSAEWGRWILREGCLGSAESMLLIYRFGFDLLGLSEMYSRTLSSNSKVLKLHDSLGSERSNSGGINAPKVPEKNHFIEHRVTKNLFESDVRMRLEKLAVYIFEKSEFSD